MTRRIRIGFAAVLVGLAFARPVHACSCGWPPSARQALIEADAVFLGRVTGIRVPDSEADAPFRISVVEVDFDVAVGWKGIASGRTTVTTAADEAACGYGFTVGASYLVYAAGTHPARLETGLCTRTRRAALGPWDWWQLGDILPASPSKATTRRLLQRLRSPHEARRVQACNALALRPSAADRSVPRLAALLDEEHHVEIRLSAASALRLLGPLAIPAIPALIDMLEDDDARIGLAAAEALEATGSIPRSFLPRMLALMSDVAESSELRQRLAERLADEDRREQWRISERLSLLSERRDAIARTIARLGTSAGPEAFDALVAGILRGSLDGRTLRPLRGTSLGPECAARLASRLEGEATSPTTLWALESLGPDAAVAVARLVPLLASEDAGPRRQAAAVLREIGPAAAEATPALLDALTQGRLDERAGIEAIAAIGSIEAAPALARAMRSSEREDVRRIARSGLEAMRMDPDAVEVAGDRPAPE